MKIQEDKIKESEETYSGEYDFRLCLGNEPMDLNMFNMIVPKTLEKLMFQNKGWFCAYYEPIRNDGVSVIQVSRPEFDGNFHVEVVVKSEHWRGFSIYAKNDVNYIETIQYFREVMERYRCPDLSEWEEITENVRYRDGNE